MTPPGIDPETVRLVVQCTNSHLPVVIVCKEVGLCADCCRKQIRATCSNKLPDIWYANVDIELLITAFFNGIRHPGEASLSTALKKKIANVGGTLMR